MMRTALIGLVLLSCYGCQPKPIDEAALLKYVSKESNGLTKKVEYNDFVLQAAYRPTDLIVKHQMEKGTPKEIDSLRKIYSPYLYFVLTIERDGKDLETGFAMNLGTFADKISYLTSSFSENIVLATAEKTYSVTDYLYTRSYGTGPSRFLVVFEKPKETDFELVVEGHSLGFGKVKFPFSYSYIKNIPLLKL
jgi:hypothetical protein